GSFLETKMLDHRTYFPLEGTILLRQKPIFSKSDCRRPPIFSKLYPHIFLSAIALNDTPI
ncbi:hypothetical protein, partial [Sinomicrobium sp. M5D2P17]